VVKPMPCCAPRPALLAASISALVLLAAGAASAQSTLATPAVDRILAEHPLVLAFGVETAWGAVHPSGEDLLHTLEVYDTDPWGGLFDINFIAEARWRLGTLFEVGLHGGYNGILTNGTRVDQVNIASQEVGPVARLFLGRDYEDGAIFEVALRLEGGYMRSAFTAHNQVEVDHTLFVRPALGVGVSGGAGFEVAFGWTFALVPGGLGGQDLPLGGMDLSFIVHFEPPFERRAQRAP